MEIPRDLRPADPVVRKRAADQATNGGKTGGGKRAAGSDSTPTADQANFGDAEAIGRYVAVLKTMNPANLHKVEDLRARIADGSYTADPEELADLLLGRDPGAGTGRKPV